MSLLTSYEGLRYQIERLVRENEELKKLARLIWENRELKSAIRTQAGGLGISGFASRLGEAAASPSQHQSSCKRPEVKEGEGLGGCPGGEPQALRGEGLGCDRLRSQGPSRRGPGEDPGPRDVGRTRPHHLPHVGAPPLPPPLGGATRQLQLGNP
ncbi:hypothetical protein MC885_008660 [Smutsia gigantea]|nr:hypothetical protein MC885_008660 [Smutsia gigantea]